MAGEVETGVPTAPLSPWRDRRFRIFAVGNSVNNIGDSVYDVTLPLLAYELTGSLTAMAALAAYIPATLLLGPVLGAVADRWGARLLVVPGLLVQLCSGVVIVAVALGDSTPLWLLFTFGATLQVGGAAYRVGWMTGVPAMFPDNAVRARGTLSSLFVSTTIIGPLIVAALVGPVGYVGLLAVNLVTFLAPIVVWYLGIQPPRPDSVPAAGRLRLGRDIAEGWRVIRAERRLWAAVLVGLPLEFVFSVGTTSLFVFYMRDLFQVRADSVALILMVANLGALAGSLSVSERKRLRVLGTLVVITIGAVACLVTMSIMVLWVVVAGFVFFYILDGMTGVTYSVIPVRYLPTEKYGRALGFIRLVLGVPAFLAPMIIAMIGELLAPSFAFLLIAGVGLVSVILLWRLRSAWAMERVAAGWVADVHEPGYRPPAGGEE
jgi:MFS family permease